MNLCSNTLSSYSTAETANKVAAQLMKKGAESMSMERHYTYDGEARFRLHFLFPEGKPFWTSI